MPNEANVLGVLSLIVWALIMIVTVKYIGFIMRADNRGEGGELALLALILQTQQRADNRRRFLIIALGLTGAALSMATASSRRPCPCSAQLKG